MSRALVLTVLIALLAMPGSALGAGPKFTAGAAGIGDPYFPLDGNGGYDVQHYDLAVSYDPETDELVGEATITAVATQNLSTFNLDFVGLSLRSLTVDGKDAKTKRKGQELKVRVKGGITTGSTFTVVAQYDGVPQPIEELGISGFLHTEDGAIVIGEPHVAATWFPANDHPRDKASFTIAISVPEDIEAISNGILVSQESNGGWDTWTWDAVEPMAPYLAMMAIGQFDVRAYEADGIAYWDAIDSALMEGIPAVPPASGDQLLYSQTGEPAFKRLTRTIAVPPGGATLSFQAVRDTEPAWDHFFVESRTAGGDDWTTLPDVNGHTTQDVGACPFFLEPNPFLEHYLTPVLVNENDPSTPDDDEWSCDPAGTSGDWHAASGASDGWESWSVALPNTTSGVVQVEVSISYASDAFVQFSGVALDDIVVSTGEGSTSFEDDGDELDGWVAPIAGPEGSADNPDTWVTATSKPRVPGIGESALLSFDRQPEIIAWASSLFGAYPFSASGGIVDEAGVGFALENQTRPTYSPFFFEGGQGNDSVVVHELAHQWYGDSLAVDTWQHIWLNEGFATYAEWLWSEAEGFETTAQIFDSFAEIPADDPFWELAIGDPGPVALFDFPVYARGAMTLEALRQEIGDDAFFQVLEAWATTQAGGTVTTRELIDLAESIASTDLDPLFEVWLSSGKPPIGEAFVHRQLPSMTEMPAVAQELVRRLHDNKGNPFREVFRAPSR